MIFNENKSKASVKKPLTQLILIFEQLTHME